MLPGIKLFDLTGRTAIITGGSKDAAADALESSLNQEHQNVNGSKNYYTIKTNNHNAEHDETKVLFLRLGIVGLYRRCSSIPSATSLMRVPEVASSASSAVMPARAATASLVVNTVQGKSAVKLSQ